MMEIIHDDVEAEDPDTELYVNSKNFRIILERFPGEMGGDRLS